MEGKIKPSEHFNGTEVYDFPVSDTRRMAAEILQIEDDEASKLFYLTEWGVSNGWPKEFAIRLEDCEAGTQEYVQVIVDRNEHYIATGE